MDVMRATEASTQTSPSSHGVTVVVEHLHRRFGSVVALADLNLTVAAGELCALVGPSGSGKTTALRVLAGLERPDRGRVVFDGLDVTTLPASRRQIGMVFQAYSLFPTMSALENVAFGLRLRRVGRRRREARARELLDLVGLARVADRRPHQLSGGQAQRVALARALAIEPRVLLLDEPLSALDASVRVRLRDEIRRIQRDVGITTIVVTHDQEEALTIADRVAVMRDGQLEQVGTPPQIYHTPRTAFVAGFIGRTNRIPAVATPRGRLRLLDDDVDLPPGLATPSGRVLAYVRPEALSLIVDPDGPGRVERTTFRGASLDVHVRWPGLADPLIVSVPPTPTVTLEPSTSVRVVPSSPVLFVEPSPAS